MPSQTWTVNLNCTDTVFLMNHDPCSHSRQLISCPCRATQGNSSHESCSHLRQSILQQPHLIASGAHPPSPLLFFIWLNPLFSDLPLFPLITPPFLSPHLLHLKMSYGRSWQHYKHIHASHPVPLACFWWLSLREVIPGTCTCYSSLAQTHIHHCLKERGFYRKNS